MITCIRITLWTLVAVAVLYLAVGCASPLSLPGANSRFTPGEVTVTESKSFGQDGKLVDYEREVRGTPGGYDGPTPDEYPVPGAEITEKGGVRIGGSEGRRGFKGQDASKIAAAIAEVSGRTKVALSIVGVGLFLIVGGLVCLKLSIPGMNTLSVPSMITGAALVLAGGAIHARPEYGWPALIGALLIGGACYALNARRAGRDKEKVTQTAHRVIRNGNAIIKPIVKSDPVTAAELLKRNGPDGEALIEEAKA